MRHAPVNAVLPITLAQLTTAGSNGVFEVMPLNTNPPSDNHWAAGTAVLQHAHVTSNEGHRAAQRPAYSTGEGTGGEDDYAEEVNPRPSKRNKGGAGNSQADYAMRHQAAEQRRRARINERLEALRKLVPHDPRSNTASFLEDVIKHILTLKDTIEKLEQALLAAHPQGVVAAVAAARNAPSAPPPMRVAAPSPIAPPPANLVQVQNVQHLLAIQTQATQPHAGVVLPPPLISPGTQTLLAQEVDTSNMHVQHALLALQQPGITAEQQEALLRSILNSGGTVQMLSAGPLGLAHSPEGPPQGVVTSAPSPQPVMHMSNGFETLLTAVSHLANGGVLDNSQGLPQSPSGQQGD